MSKLKLLVIIGMVFSFVNMAIPSFAEKGTNVPINITFDDAGCPLSVDNEPAILQVDRMIWQAVDQEGNEIGENYSLYFEPFSKQATLFTVNGRGKIRSPKVDPDAPWGPYIEYKYTIVGHACPDFPLDPRFVCRR